MQLWKYVENLRNQISAYFQQGRHVDNMLLTALAGQRFLKNPLHNINKLQNELQKGPRGVQRPHWVDKRTPVHLSLRAPSRGTNKIRARGVRARYWFLWVRASRWKIDSQAFGLTLWDLKCEGYDFRLWAVGLTCPKSNFSRSVLPVVINISLKNVNTQFGIYIQN